MFLYILKCEDDSYYIGITSCPERRLKQHLGIIKGGAKYTKLRHVVSVEALWENKSGKYARSLEALLKNKLSHKDKQKLIENPFMSFSEFNIDIPDNEFAYVDPKNLNKKLGLSKNH